MQEQELKEPKQYFTGENKKEIFQSGEKENMTSCNLDSKADNKHSYNQQNNDSGDYLFSHWEIAIIMMQHWQRGYKHRNAKRKRRK